MRKYRASDLTLLGVRPIPVISRLSEQPSRELRRVIDIPVKEKRPRGPEWGPGELEMRAVPGEGTILERIVEKKLLEILGLGSFVSQYAMLGGRTYIGGYVVDFIITARQPPVALEIVSEYWHGPGREGQDTMRALIVESQGYIYVEVFEWEIMIGDEYLEKRIVELIGL